jgi:hypothetical protein
MFGDFMKFNLSRCIKGGVLGLVAVSLGAIALLLATNPTQEQHVDAMREYASWEAPYSITDSQLAAGGFEYRRYRLYSVTRLADGVYTYGFLSIVRPTHRLRSKLVQLYIQNPEKDR